MPPRPPSSGRRGRRKGLLVGGGVLGLAAVAGGAFAVYQVGFATGPQPAEALPASTIGYVSVDLDPSGKQKLEALETLEKFPAFNDNVDIDSEDDLRAELFDYARDSGACPEIDFDDDIEPWLGDRFGFAAVDVGDELAGDTGGIAPVGVVQVKDADAAEAGLEKIRDCAVGGESAPEADLGGWAIEGDWAVIAETTEIAEAVSEAAQDEPLSDDKDFEKWTEAAGDPGILTAYAAPEVGDFISEGLSGLPFGGPSCGFALAEPLEGTDGFSDDFSSPSYEEDCGEDGEGSEEADAVEGAFADFSGAAVTVRFDDGGVEVEAASSVDYLGLDSIYGSEGGDDVVAGLPDDTAIAFGLGFEEGWFTELTDYLDSMSGGFFDVQEGLEAFEAETGLSLPEDVETLAGVSAAIAVGGDLDPETLGDGPVDQPFGLKVKGDTDEISSIIDRLVEDPEVRDELTDAFAYQQDDEHVVAGFSDEWSDRLLEGGDLGGTDDYEDVVRESEDAAAVLFVNFDQGGWLERLVESDGGDPEVLRNVEPLRALGISAWTDDDDVSHSVFRLTTD